MPEEIDKKIVAEMQRRYKAGDSVPEIIRHVLQTYSPHMFLWKDGLYKVFTTQMRVSASTVSQAKSQMISKGDLEYNNVNDIIKLCNPYSLSGEKESAKHIWNVRPLMIEYFKEYYVDEICREVKSPVLDLQKLFSERNHIPEIRDMLERLIIDDYSTYHQILNECYEDAYYTLNNDKIKAYVGLKNIPTTFMKNAKQFKIEYISSDLLGRLVEFEGDVLVATRIQTALKEAVCICSGCGEKKKASVENPFEAFFEPICPKCAQNMSLIENESKYIDYQELKIQQPLELMDNPEDPPKVVTVFVENTPGVYSGRVKITGIPIKFQRNKKIPLYQIHVKANNIEILGSNARYVHTPEEIEKIHRVLDVVSTEGYDIVDIVSENLVPHVSGLQHIKTAILLQQVKGANTGKRENIHIYVCSDPGIAKSTMGKHLRKIPGHIFTSVPTVTAVGLTVAVGKEKTEIGDDTPIIKPGALPKANGGTCCLDELTAANKDSEIMAHILEALEDGEIHINKMGINTKIKANCGVLAFSNPRRGRFDKNLPALEQIHIFPSFLDRMDLIFVEFDDPDKSKDKLISSRIISDFKVGLKAQEGNAKEIFKKHYSKTIASEIIDEDFIISYIMYARNWIVTDIEEEAEKRAQEYYIDMRATSLSMSARYQNTILRLASSYAKARLHKEITLKDVNDAISILEISLKQVAYDPATGRYDIDKISNISSPERKRMTKIYDTMKAVINNPKNDSDLAHIEDIVDALKEEYTESSISASLKKLIKNGEIDEPKTGKYRII